MCSTQFFSIAKEGVERAQPYSRSDKWVLCLSAKGVLSLANFYLETKGFSESEEREGSE